MTEIEINIPESWADVKLSQYLDFYKAVKPYEGTDEYQRIVFERSILHFCNVSAEILYKLPTTTLDEMKASIYDFIGKGMEQPLITTFRLGETTYGFEPNIEEIKYGPYLDAVSYSKDLWAYIPLLMAVLYRPVVDKRGQAYSIKPYTGTDDNVVDLFKSQLTMDIVWGAISFFLLLQKELVKGTLAYSQKVMKNLTPQQTSAVKEILTKNGLDIAQLQHYLEIMSSNLTQ